MDDFRKVLHHQFTTMSTRELYQWYVTEQIKLVDAMNTVVPPTERAKSVEGALDYLSDAMLNMTKRLMLLESAFAAHLRNHLQEPMK